jgi:hypothetical protein
MKSEALTEAMKIYAKSKTGSVCTLCGQAADSHGAFFPDKSTDWGAQPGKQRVFFYALCKNCDKLNDRMERIENKIKSDRSKMTESQQEYEFKHKSIDGFKQHIDRKDKFFTAMEEVSSMYQNGSDRVEQINIPWNIDYTLSDLAKVNPEKFYHEALVLKAKSLEKTKNENAEYSFYNFLSRSVTEVLYIRLGRKRWLVNSSMIELLSSLKYEDVKLEDVVFPYDCYTLVLPSDTKLTDGGDIQWIRIMRMKSDLASKLLMNGPPFGTVPEPEEIIRIAKGCLVIQAAFGAGPNDVQVLSIPVEKYAEAAALAEQAKDKDLSLSFCLKLAISSALYYAARPELIRNHELPRSCRYRFKQGRENIQMIHLPEIPKYKIVSEDKPDLDPDGRTKGLRSPHYRGWVIRVLRKPRFRRNPDGSFRVILVPPCAIHPELMGDE